MKQHLRDIVSGMVVGVANIIPGVSGGTMALVLGFYERLIGGINNISGATVVSFARALSFKREHLDGFRREFERIEGPFLMKIVAGALISIGALAKVMSYLLEIHHDPTYGFFFGLVLVSAWTPWALIRKKSLPVLAAILVAAAAIIAVSQLSSPDDLIRKAEARNAAVAQSVETGGAAVATISAGRYAYLFVSGAIAISAMILPGISGSFVLLLMGGYFDILRAVATLDLPVLAVFAAGCLGGIVAFTRLLHFLLRRFYDPTLGFLLGLVLGSLWVIWPFKHTVTVGPQTVYLANRLPRVLGSNEIATLAAFIAGALIVAVMIRLENERGEGAA